VNPFGAAGFGSSNSSAFGAGGCFNFLNTNTGPNGVGNQQLVNINDSTVNRWGAGIVQEIDAAAMHVFFRWQHLELNNLNVTCGQDVCEASPHRFVAEGQKFSPSFNGLDIFQIGGVIFF
jgi:hypothetical protein